jgi:hypothetical protein
MRIPDSLSDSAASARCMVASPLVMKCPSTRTFKSSYSMCGGIDFMIPFPKSKDCEYILVAVDYMSKGVEALPCRADDAKHAYKMFQEVIFPHFGTPMMVISDRGSHFIDKTF